MDSSLASTSGAVAFLFSVFGVGLLHRDGDEAAYAVGVRAGGFGDAQWNPSMNFRIFSAVSKWPERSIITPS